MTADPARDAPCWTDDAGGRTPGPAALARSSAVKRIDEADGEYRGPHQDGHTYARRYDAPDPAEAGYRAWRLHQAAQITDDQHEAACRLADMWTRAHVRGAHTRDGSPDDLSAEDRWLALIRGRRDGVLLVALVTGAGPGWHRLPDLQAALDVLVAEWGIGERATGAYGGIRAAEVG